MWIPVLQLLGGLVLIIKGGDLFVAAAVRLAELLRMPRVVVGGTLVSLATTSPELVVSIMSGLRGEPGLAVGNAIGSCVCNIGLILGVTATLKNVDINPRILRLPVLAMAACGVLLLGMSFDLSVSREQGWILLAVGAGYFIWDFARHARSRRPADVAEATAIETVVAATRFPWFRTRAGTVVQFLAGAAVVVVGSRFLVDGAVSVASLLGIRPLVIGLTVVAVGTSLPELVTAVSSARHSVSDLAVGNVIGANVANLTLIIGTAAALSEVRMTRVSQLFNFPALLLVIAVLYFMISTGNRIGRREGVFLLGMYAVYLAGVVVLAMSGRGG